MWIVQELTVAKEIVFYCGADSVSGPVLSEAQKLLGRIDATDGFSDGMLCKYLPQEPNVRSAIRYLGIEDVQTWRSVLASKDMSFFECLQYHYHRKASDPRDMVYGLAAFVNTTSKYQIEVDYSKTVSEVYTDFAITEITFSKRLDILTRVRRGSNYHGLPSWVPDWSVTHYTGPTHFFLHNIDDPKSQFRASGTSEAEATHYLISARPRLDVLGMKAIYVGRIRNIGVNPTMRDGKDVKQAISTVVSWFDLLDRQDKGSAVDQEAFARTIFCGRVSETEIGAWTIPEFLRGLLGAYGHLCQEYYPWRKDIDPVLLELWDATVIKARQMAQAAGVEYNAKAQENTWLTWIRNAAFRMWDRKLFLTTRGVMGLAPEQAPDGDQICVPLGCSVPLIVRESELNSRVYTVVGEAYVDGFMYGRAIELMQQGELDMDEFELH
jgi:hypothetical protein